MGRGTHSILAQWRNFLAIRLNFNNEISSVNPRVSQIMLPSTRQETFSVFIFHNITQIHRISATVINKRIAASTATTTATISIHKIYYTQSRPMPFWAQQIHFALKNVVEISRARRARVQPLVRMPHLYLKSSQIIYNIMYIGRFFIHLCSRSVVFGFVACITTSIQHACKANTHSPH